MRALPWQPHGHELVVLPALLLLLLLLLPLALLLAPLQQQLLPHGA